MRKAGYGYLAIAVALMGLAMFVLSPSGAGPGALPREMAFDMDLRNSLYDLGQARAKWAEEKNKSEGETPTMEELAPFLGVHTNNIKRLVAEGVEFKIGPYSEMGVQSDAATLTRDIVFQIGFSRFYGAGTRYSVQENWTSPPLGIGTQFIAIYENTRGLLVIGLLALTMGSVLMYAVKMVRKFKEVGSASRDQQGT